MKNIDFTDFFNVFLSGATISVDVFFSIPLCAVAGYGLSFALCQPQVAQGIKEKAGRVPGFQTVEKGKEVKEKSGEQA